MIQPDIQPADRLKAIKEYYFSRRLREVTQLRAQGRDIISIAIGGPDRMPDDKVVETLCTSSHHPDAHSYQTTRGTEQLRKAYANFYRRHYGVTLDPDTEIQPLIGSKEGILTIALTFLNPGDKVLVPNPGYPTYTSACRLVQADIVPYDLDPQHGWQPDFDALEQSDLNGVKLMFVNYPHMPTGAPANLDLFHRIIGFGHRHSIVIVNDNPYSFILNDNPLSIFQIPGAKEIAIELNSLSKSHNMAGWRMGMAISNPTFINWILKVRSNIDSGQFRPMLDAAVAACNLPDEWYTELNDVYRRRRVIAEQIMHALRCTFDPSQRGLFLWGRIPDDEPSGESLADRMLYDAGIFITPGFIFGSAGDRYIRISLCATEEALRNALQRITDLPQNNNTL